MPGQQSRLSDPFYAENDWVTSFRFHSTVGHVATTSDQQCRKRIVWEHAPTAKIVHVYPGLSDNFPVFGFFGTQCITPGAGNQRCQLECARRARRDACTHGGVARQQLHASLAPAKRRREYNSFFSKISARCFVCFCRCSFSFHQSALARFSIIGRERAGQERLDAGTLRCVSRPPWLPATAAALGRQCGRDRQQWKHPG